MSYIDIVFAKSPDPNPDYYFVEVENSKRESAEVGVWLTREDGRPVLRIEMPAAALHAELDRLRNDLAAAKADARNAWSRHAMANRIGNHAALELASLRQSELCGGKP